MTCTELARKDLYKHDHLNCDIMKSVASYSVHIPLDMSRNLVLVVVVNPLIQSEVSPAHLLTSRPSGQPDADPAQKS